MPAPSVQLTQNNAVSVWVFDDVAATGQSTPGVDLLGYAGDLEFVAALLVTGTTPTMLLTVQDSADNSSFAAVTTVPASFGTLTATGAYSLIIPKDGLRRYVRVNYTVGGTSPVYNGAVVLNGFKQYK